MPLWWLVAYTGWAPALLWQPVVLPHPTAPLVAGLAAVAAVILAAWLAVVLATPALSGGARLPAAAVTRRTPTRRPRVLDPAAGGRPRPRAPSVNPSAA